MDERKLLDNGKTYDFINKRSHIKYEISKCIGLGGNSVVYEVFCNDNEIGVLKELYPFDLSIERDDDGNLIVNGKDIALFEYRKEEFAKLPVKRRFLLELSSKIASTLPEHCQMYEGRNTLYFFQSKTIGKCYSEIEGDSLEDIIKTIIALLYTLKSYHEVGYVHLDVKPENMLVIKDGDNFKVQLFDFDTVTKISDLEKGKVESLPFSEDYSSPEQEKRLYNEISIASDIYSVGMILFKKIMGRFPDKRSNELSVGTKYKYDFQIGPLKDKPLIIQKYMDRLFDCTIRISSKIRCSEDDLLNQLEEILKTISNRNEIQTNYNYKSHIKKFCGRDDELDELDLCLYPGATVLIYGMGGIGKTELIKSYLENNERFFQKILYIADTGSSIRDAIIDDNNLRISGLTRREETDDEYFEIKLAIIQKECELAQNNNKSLIVVFDNSLQFENLKYLIKIRNIGCKVVVVSRNPWKGFDEFFSDKIEISRMKKENDELDLFVSHLEGGIEENNFKEIQYIQEIINRYEGHPLLLMLIAKAMNSSGKTAYEILHDMNDNGIAGGGDEPIIFMNNGNVKNELIDEAVYSFFNYGNYTNDEIEILQFMSLVPIEGIDKREIKLLFGKLIIIDSLVSRGFISYENSFYKVHPIIREMAEKKYPIISDKFVNMFIEALSNNLKEVDTVRLSPYAFIGRTLEKRIEIKSAKFYQILANMCHRLGMYELADKFYYSNINLIREEYGDNHYELGIAYSRYGRAQRVSGFLYESKKNLQMAIEIFDKNMELYGNELGMVKLNYADTYNQLALVYRDLGDCKKALYFETIAYETAKTFEEIDKTHQDFWKRTRIRISQFSEGMGGILFEDGKYSEALNYYHEAEIMEENYSFYSILGIARCELMLENYGIAELKIREAIDLVEKERGYFCLEAAKTYYVAAKIFQAQQYQDEAVMYYEQALRIEKKILGEDSNYTLLIEVDFIYYKHIAGIDAITFVIYNDIKHKIFSRKRPSIDSYKQMNLKMKLLSEILGLHEECWN